MGMTIDAAGMHYRDLNSHVKGLLSQSEERINLANVNGQRYIAGGIQGPYQMTIQGVPGNDLGMFMDGPQITVYGNVQDGVANTMNSGRIFVHGSAGDALGYGMRGGEVFIRDRVGYRAGIHMKQYLQQIPVLVIGETAGNFLGEYMAGGIIVVLNLRREKRPVGHYCGTGLHGGVIYIRTTGEEGLPTALPTRPVDADDVDLLAHYQGLYHQEFGGDIPPWHQEDFIKIVPDHSRPYKQMYVGI